MEKKAYGRRIAKASTYDMLYIIVLYLYMFALPTQIVAWSNRTLNKHF